MKQLDNAKWSYLTRRVVDHRATRTGGFVREPRLGDLVVTKVVSVGAHDHLENPHGRRVRLYPGDMVVGAFGNRYATDFYEGYLPSGETTHLLSAGGLVGAVVSAHTRLGPPTELKVIGALTDRTGVGLSLEDFAVPTPPPMRAELGTVVVLGSSMNSGKTTTAAAIVRGWTRAGVKAAAGKVTGSGSGKDHWTYADAGATEVVDFVDFGMPSTFGYPIQRLKDTMAGMRDMLAHRNAAAVVLEIADGLLQAETRALAACLPGFADGVVLTASDALGAVAGVEILRGAGISVRAVSGLVTASPLASREAAAATGLPILSPSALAEGAATDLLARNVVPV
jgi:hypothetical protein